MINRRNFLTGIVAAAAGSQLIVEASNEDVQRFATAKTVGVIKPDNPDMIMSGHQFFTPVTPGQILYNDSGNPVGVVDNLEMRHSDDNSYRYPRNYLSNELDELTATPGEIFCRAEVHCFYDLPRRGVPNVNFKT